MQCWELLCKHTLLASPLVLGAGSAAGCCLGCRTLTERGGWCSRERMAEHMYIGSLVGLGAQFGQTVMYQPSCKCPPNPALLGATGNNACAPVYNLAREIKHHREVRHKILTRDSGTTRACMHSRIKS